MKEKPHDRRHRRSAPDRASERIGGHRAGRRWPLGSHIDTVFDAGIYDVLSGLAVIEAMQVANVRPPRPIAIVAYTNEEGVRYAPDMMVKA